MNEQDVIQELRSLVKPYEYVKMPQSQFSNTIIRLEAGLLKPKTITDFFKQFGFEKENGVYVQTRIVCDQKKNDKKLN